MFKKTSIIYKIEDRLGELKTGRMELGLCLYMLSCYTPDGGTHGMMANTKTWGDSFNYMCGAMGTCTVGWDDLHKKARF